MFNWTRLGGRWKWVIKGLSGREREDEWCCVSGLYPGFFQGEGPNRGPNYRSLTYNKAEKWRARGGPLNMALVCVCFLMLLKVELTPYIGICPFHIYTLAWTDFHTLEIPYIGRCVKLQSEWVEGLLFSVDYIFGELQRELPILESKYLTHWVLLTFARASKQSRHALFSICAHRTRTLSIICVNILKSVPAEALERQELKNNNNLKKKKTNSPRKTYFCTVTIQFFHNKYTTIVH